jgi:predicted nucleotidyltransferase
LVLGGGAFPPAAPLHEQSTASDIDLLVIGSPREEVLAQAVRRLERQLGREVNYTASSSKTRILRSK